MRSLHLRLLMAFLPLLAVLWWQTAQAQEDSATVCVQRLRQIGRALQRYRHVRGRYPSGLSELYPQYITDKNVLRCPADATYSVPESNRYLADRVIPCSYVYEMSTNRVVDESDDVGPTLGWPLEENANEVTRQQLRVAQRRYFGNWVPLVRCMHHRDSSEDTSDDIINLACSGQIYCSSQVWQVAFPVLRTLLARMKSDLTGNAEQFLSQWPAWDIAAYFDYVRGSRLLPECLHLPLRSIAFQVKNITSEHSINAKGEASYVAAVLYHTSGDLINAITCYERAALGIPEEFLDDSCSRLDELYTVTGQAAKAVRFYERVVALRPNDTQYMAKLACAYRQAGRETEAIEWDLRSKMGAGNAKESFMDFRLPTLGEERISLRELLHGKKALLVITGSDDLLEELPLVQDLCNRLGQAGLSTVAIDLGDARSHHWGVIGVTVGKRPVMDRDVGFAFMYYLLDAQGHILYAGGFEERSLRRLLAKIGVK